MKKKGDVVYRGQSAARAPVLDATKRCIVDAEAGKNEIFGDKGGMEGSQKGELNLIAIFGASMALKRRLFVMVSAAEI